MFSYMSSPTAIIRISCTHLRSDPMTLLLLWVTVYQSSPPLPIFMFLLIKASVSQASKLEACPYLPTVVTAITITWLLQPINRLLTGYEMVYICEKKQDTGSRDREQERDRKRKNSTIVSPILIYDTAENKQVKSACRLYLPSPVSLPEQENSHTMMTYWSKMGKVEIMFKAYCWKWPLYMTEGFKSYLIPSLLHLFHQEVIWNCFSKHAPFWCVISSQIMLTMRILPLPRNVFQMLFFSSFFEYEYCGHLHLLLSEIKS